MAVFGQEHATFFPDGEIRLVGCGDADEDVAIVEVITGAATIRLEANTDDLLKLHSTLSQALIELTDGNE